MGGKWSMFGGTDKAGTAEGIRCLANFNYYAGGLDGLRRSGAEVRRGEDGRHSVDGEKA